MKCVKYFKRQSQHFNFYCHLSPVSAKKKFDTIQRCLCGLMLAKPKLQILAIKSSYTRPV